MTNDITFANTYKSINGLNSVQFPKFVVLTGRNGSGKSHLLAAIKSGQIRSSLVSDHARDVRLFDANNIVPGDTGRFDPNQIWSQRTNWFDVIKNARNSNFENFKNSLMQSGFPPEYCTSYKYVASLSAQDLVKLIPAHPEVEAASANLFVAMQTHLQNFASAAYAQFQNNLPDEQTRQAAASIFSKSPSFYLTASQSEFFEHAAFLWGGVDPFQQAFGRTFVTYRELLHSNSRLREFPPEEATARIYLEKDAFIGQFGEPPWDFVNRILEVCLLDFKINHPKLHEVGAYEPRLFKVSSGIEMGFQDLSSGEKVLMSFALCLYNAQEARQEKVFPKLLLLDEIDAPLHPSMVSSLLKIIQEVLVEEKNVYVILTTHSPSTVAMAPEEAIYVMNPQNPRIEKIRKAEALAVLTAGVPTLSISFEGRRQVFVESYSDAKLYDSLYQLYKSELASERSLVFIEVGQKNKDGLEQNAGCEQVIRFVNELEGGGNDSVFGLVDWDGKRHSTSRLHVLSSGLRDGIENLLLDPVLVLSMIVKFNSAYALEKKIIGAQESYLKMQNWSQEEWQLNIDRLQRMILGETYDENEVFTISYLSGMNLRVSKRYLHMDDHALEALVLDKVQPLKSLKSRGGVMNYCVTEVLRENPKLIPFDLLIVFRDLLGAEISTENTSIATENE